MHGEGLRRAFAHKYVTGIQSCFRYKKYVKAYLKNNVEYISQTALRLPAPTSVPRLAPKAGAASGCPAPLQQTLPTSRLTPASPPATSHQMGAEKRWPSNIILCTVYLLRQSPTINQGYQSAKPRRQCTSTSTAPTLVSRLVVLFVSTDGDT